MASFLLDEGLQLRTAALLRARGIDAQHVDEVGLGSTDDALILEFARTQKRVCITLDHDFHTILAETNADGPSTIFIRGQRLNHLGAADFIERLIVQLGSQLDLGIAVYGDVARSEVAEAAFEIATTASYRPFWPLLGSCFDFA
jgi:predicted nuclease of predicted toxin-antitoxin system